VGKNISRRGRGREGNEAEVISHEIYNLMIFTISLRREKEDRISFQIYLLKSYRDKHISKWKAYS
jgi:hypothetical protein